MNPYQKIQPTMPVKPAVGQYRGAPRPRMAAAKARVASHLPAFKKGGVVKGKKK